MIKKINIEEFVKGLLRAFRRNEKTQFDSVFNRKHYHWVDTVVREKTFEYYTTINDTNLIDPVFYKNNEEAFFRLIHNNWDKKTLKKSKKASSEIEMAAMPDPNLYKEVFG